MSRLGLAVLADRGESSTQLDVPLFDLSGEGACADWNTVRGPCHLTGDADRGYDGVLRQATVGIPSVKQDPPRRWGRWDSNPQMSGVLSAPPMPIRLRPL